MQTHEQPEFMRAERLEAEFRRQLKGNQDWLSEYRKWLDQNNIPAENPDGWPTEDAYDPNNIGKFIQYQLMV